MCPSHFPKIHKEADKLVEDRPFEREYAGQTVSKRAKKKQESEKEVISIELRGEALALEEVAVTLDAEACKVRDARETFRIEKQAALEAASDGDRSQAGIISAAYAAALNHHSISPQRYWKHSLNGPDARKLALVRESVLGSVRDAMTNKGGEAATMADVFYKRHCAVLKEFLLCLIFLARQQNSLKLSTSNWQARAKPPAPLGGRTTTAFLPSRATLSNSTSPRLPGALVPLGFSARMVSSHFTQQTASAG
jgi:hypothetical protein